MTGASPVRTFLLRTNFWWFDCWLSPVSSEYMRWGWRENLTFCLTRISPAGPLILVSLTWSRVPGLSGRLERDLEYCRVLVSAGDFWNVSPHHNPGLEICSNTLPLKYCGWRSSWWASLWCLCWCWRGRCRWTHSSPLHCRHCSLYDLICCQPAGHS